VKTYVPCRAVSTLLLLFHKRQSNKNSRITLLPRSLTSSASSLCYLFRYIARSLDCHKCHTPHMTSSSEAVVVVEPIAIFSTKRRRWKTLSMILNSSIIRPDSEARWQRMSRAWYQHIMFPPFPYRQASVAVVQKGFSHKNCTVGQACFH
jgi:hypothetical protein